MDIFGGFNGAAKTVAAGAQTITWTSAEIPQRNAHYSIDMTGGTALSDTSRIKVKGGSESLWDISQTYLRAFQQRLGRSNLAPLATATRFVIPFYSPDGKGDQRYASEFPRHLAPSVEIDTATASAGGATIGWSTWTGKSPWYPKYVGVPMNIAASTTNGRYPISLSTGSLLRGVCLPTTGVTRARLVLGIDVFNLSDEHLLAYQSLENTLTLTHPLFIKLHRPLPAPVGQSYIELDTGAGFGGVTEEIGLYTLLPQVVE